MWSQKPDAFADLWRSWQRLTAAAKLWYFCFELLVYLNNTRAWIGKIRGKGEQGNLVSEFISLTVVPRLKGQAFTAVKATLIAELTPSRSGSPGAVMV
jgi:hypothetical protein